MASRQLDEERVFHLARQITIPAARSEYLDQVRAGDQALRERVEALLAVHEREQEFLKSVPAPAATVDQPPISEAAGQEIGRFKLLQEIGEGGFGVVYMAEQTRPVRRKVALKVIKPGMDTKAVVARFEAERQALAMMDHEHIARVLDGGATDSGRPYFVMELVKGVPITEYCDQNHLPTDERLRLFMTVCQAVQHAHQKGIIHRDIKPSNVLVTLHDGKPVAKVIDFGVAKAINQQLTEKTLFTSYGQMIGTPQYMSPEQAEMSGLDVDTRSDIYSLGVLLYELLTGTTPLESERLRTAGYAEMQRLIREEEPPKPSTRLSTSGEKLTAIAKHRNITPDRLQRLVRGDLDWIVMRSLEKDRSRRYATASNLAADVERFLNDEPIEAHAPSAGYRLRKYVLRNKVSFTAATTVFLGLAIGFAAACYGLIEASRERQKLGETLRSLQDELVDRVLADALAGDIIATEASLERAIRNDVSPNLILALQGLAYLNGGNLKRGIQLLEGANAKEPENEAVLAALSEAYLNAGRYWEIRPLHEAISRLQSDPGNTRGDLERLLLARMEVAGVSNHAQFIDELTQIVIRHPRWGIAYAVRSEAWREKGKNSKQVRDLERARNDADTAVGYYPKNPYVVATALAAYAASIELIQSTEHEAAHEVDAWKLRAGVLAERMEPYAEYTWGRLKRLEYYRLLGDNDALNRERQRLLAAGIGGRQPKAARLLVARDRAGLLALEGEAGFDLGPTLARITLTVIEGNSSGALEEMEKLWKQHRHFAVLDPAFVAGRPDIAEKFTKEAMPWIETDRAALRCDRLAAQYFIGQIDEQELREALGPFHVESSVAEYAIGMKRLSTAGTPAELDYAQQCLQKAADCVIPGWYHTEFAKAYVQLIKKGVIKPRLAPTNERMSTEPPESVSKETSP